jgi:hypothetical protein
VRRNLALGHRAYQHIRLGNIAVRIVFEALPASVITLQPNPRNAFLLPHADDTKALPWRERHLHTAIGLKLGCSHNRYKLLWPRKAICATSPTAPPPGSSLGPAG